MVAGYGQKKDYDKIKQAFKQSFKVVTAWENGNLIGAVRILSDGVCYGMILEVGVYVGKD
ncbi:hypothetical protein [Desulfosporosinus sp. FKA]|uniref:hypothetical protein n=1 Tax=Desulfosporosinus sp. FKA TaxID=1969834 RepID=UPI001A9A6878|nr:hypothetical protein [Desulfosporosinus sp. FKA]